MLSIFILFVKAFLGYLQQFPHTVAITMKTVAKNRRARFDYDIVDTIEAGIMLTGQEVKSCRQGNVNLSGAYVSLLNNKPVLKSATIAPYKFASNIDAYESGRDRPLLLHKKELDRIQSALEEQGVSVIPLEVKAGKHIKVLLGLGKGQKRIDKRHKIKEKDMKRRLKQGREI